jgi:L,D-transpeptidase ErfK/SrfK
VYSRNALRIYLGSAVLLLSVQFQAAAQTVAEVASTANQPISARTSLLNPQPVTLELPPIQPILPDIPAEEVRLVLRVGERRVYVYRGDEVQASYPVAVGKSGWETPTGDFEVLGMLQNPGWTNPFTGEVVAPGPQNPLGERWIAFWTDGRNFVGFHGTPNRESVGRAASHGCVRMYNEDIRELFELVQVGTSVTVVN